MFFFFGTIRINKLKNKKLSDDKVFKRKQRKTEMHCATKLKNANVITVVYK